MKKRLIGAIVLVCLAVIFVPMLLEQRSASRMPAFGTNVPDQPDERFERLDIPLESPDSAPAVEQTVVEDEKQAAKLEQSIPNTASHSPRKESTSSAEPDKSPSEPPPAEDPRALDSAKSSSENSTPSDLKGWVVQIGSFAQSENAFRLRKQVRDKGFPAFVEQVRSGTDVIYRVRVGPEMERKQADALKAKLARQLQIDGLVMSHP